MTDPYRTCACRKNALDVDEKPAPKRERRNWLELAVFTAAMSFCGGSMFVAESAMNKAAKAQAKAIEQISEWAAAPPRAVPAPPRTPSPPPPLEPVLPPHRGRDLALSPSLLGSLVAQTHEPALLLARARKLREAGVDVRIVHTELGQSPFDTAVGDLHSRVVPIVVDEKTAALRISRVGADSLFALAGFRDGDLLLSVNGYPMDEPEHALAGYAVAKRAGAAVFEMARGGHRIVLDVRWP
jgi:membrane-associated protease RseP (regulator of RpoE activity)